MNNMVKKKISFAQLFIKVALAPPLEKVGF